MHSYREMRVDAIFLRKVADRWRHRIVTGVIAEYYFSIGRFEQAEYKSEQGSFTTAIRPGDSYKIAFVDCQIDIG